MLSSIILNPHYVTLNPHYVIQNPPLCHHESAIISSRIPHYVILSEAEGSQQAPEDPSTSLRMTVLFFARVVLFRRDDGAFFRHTGAGRGQYLEVRAGELV